jgi:DNA-binding response OmpR family regulator
MGKKVLIVDDEPQIVRVLRGYLESAGFEVLTAYSGHEALSALGRASVDLVVLDLNMPDMDGLDVARSIRRSPSRTTDVPIIMVTARVEETDRLIGLELGADDYVTKPFSPREVVARVRAVLRRTERSEAMSRLLQSEDIKLDLDKRQVTVSQRPVDLTATEFDLLAALIASPGRVFSRMQLLDRLQGDAYEGYERTIDAHIKNLRQKIEPDPRHPQYVLTVYGLGYKFAESTPQEAGDEVPPGETTAHA